ncbi:MAG TPA: hypothetical protein VM221_03060 [Armatimonadota bacterium]|nr:hypothetical protein [Armatimonadota bacterium]
MDDHLIACAENLTRELQPPVKHPANPLIIREHPWEQHNLQVYGTVLHEAALGKFRCWYLARGHGQMEADTPEGPLTAKYLQCYAESSDGIRWAKPMVGHGKYGGLDRHNIVIPGGHGFCVLPTPNDPDPQKRYRGLGGKIVGFSPDGIEWSTQPFSAAGKNDTSSCVIRWNSRYLAYVRNQENDPTWPGVMRAVALSTSEDFVQWTPKRTFFTTDSRDGYPWTQPYGMAVTPYGDQLIGIIWMIHLDQTPGNNRLGDLDMQLMVSRDGTSWHRVAERAVFLGPTPGSWDEGGVFPSTTLVVKDDRVHVYYTGRSARHGVQGGATGIGLATLPAERFVALRPAGAGGGGIIETPLLRFPGEDLLVNAEIEPGNLQVELYDGSGRVRRGCEGNQSQLTPHDALRYRVWWQADGKRRSLGEATGGRPAALRFILRGGALYAFQVAAGSDAVGREERSPRNG